MTETEKDATRYQFLKKSAREVQVDGGMSSHYSLRCVDKSGGNPYRKPSTVFNYKSLDEAIDSEMAKEAK